MSGLAKRVQHAAAWRSRKAIKHVKKTSKEFVYGILGWAVNRQFEPIEVDPRIEYPCYKSLDEFIDVERLQALDAYVKEKARQYLREEQMPKFNTGPFKSKLISKIEPGSKMIPLTESTRSFEYFDLDKPEFWVPSKYADDFSELMDFIETLPLKATARIMIMCDHKGRAVTPHRDHPDTEVRHEFVWFRTNLDKPFYMQDSKTRKKKYIDSYSAWFDTVNQFHGSDRTGELAISIRVDGIFSDELRQQIPTPDRNPASTAALWTSLSPNKKHTRFE